MAKLGSIVQHHANGQSDVVVSLCSVGVILSMVIAILGIKLRWFRKRIQFDQIPSGSSDSNENSQVVLRRSSRNFQEQFSEPVVAQGIFRKRLDEDVIIERPKTLPPVRIRKSSKNLSMFTPPKRNEVPVAVVEEEEQPVVIPPPPPPLPPSASTSSLSALNGLPAMPQTPTDEKVNFAPMVEIIPEGQSNQIETEPLVEEPITRQLSGRKPTGYTRPSDEIIAELQKLSDEISHKKTNEQELPEIRNGNKISEPESKPKQHEKSFDGNDNDKQIERESVTESKQYQELSTEDANDKTFEREPSEYEKMFEKMPKKQISEPEVKEHQKLSIEVESQLHNSSDKESKDQISEPKPKENQKLSDFSEKMSKVQVIQQEPKEVQSFSEEVSNNQVQDHHQLSDELSNKHVLVQEPPEPLPRTIITEKHKFIKNNSKTVKANNNNNNQQSQSQNQEDDEIIEPTIDTKKLSQRRLTGIFPSADDLNGHSSDDTDSDDDYNNSDKKQSNNKVIFKVDDTDDERNSPSPPPIRSPPPVLPPMLFITQVSNEDEDIEICESWSAIQRHRNLTQEINNQKEGNSSPIEELHSSVNGTTQNKQQPEPKTVPEMKRNNARNDLVLNSEGEYRDK